MDSGMNIGYNPFLTNNNSNNNNNSTSNNNDKDNNGRVTYTVDERIEMGSLPDPSTLSVHNLLRILDTLLACEVRVLC